MFSPVQCNSFCMSLFPQHFRNTISNEVSIPPSDIKIILVPVLYSDHEKSCCTRCRTSLVLLMLLLSGASVSSTACCTLNTMFYVVDIAESAAIKGSKPVRTVYEKIYTVLTVLDYQPTNTIEQWITEGYPVLHMIYLYQKNDANIILNVLVTNI